MYLVATKELVMDKACKSLEEKVPEVNRVTGFRAEFLHKGVCNKCVLSQLFM